MHSKLIKDFIPPFLVRQLRRSGLLFNSIKWKGNYSTWDSAMLHSVGYDSDAIIEKVRQAALSVKNGEAKYERDSVLFDEIEYSWPMLTALLWVYSQEQSLSVIDFGGALGSSYYQNKRFLDSLPELRWSIVEQEKFVKIGLAEFQNERLKFYYRIEDALNDSKVNCLLMSCVLPYIKEPHNFLDHILNYNIKYIIFDKMPFIEGDRDRLTVQVVPKKIYKASYPSWFFSEENFKEFILRKYEIVEEFHCPDVANIESVYKGMILKIK
jgi:putative methyltransferase (TIGR04325 family)